MNDQIRVKLCRKKGENKNSTQNELIAWLDETYKLKVSQGTVSNTLKRLQELLRGAETSQVSNPNLKRQKAVTYPLMEEALNNWFLTRQEIVNMSGDLLKLKGAYFLEELYPDAGPFEFSNDWLNRFKAGYSIKSFLRFGESGSVDMALIEEVLSGLRNFLNKYEWKDIYNMDKTGLFYRMQVRNANLIAASA